MAILPAKVLYINLSGFEVVATWDTDDGSGDPWIGMPYQWNATISVSPQVHSSHLTSNPYAYTGLDVNVGDLVATTNGGRFLKIIAISNRDENDFSLPFTVTLEDYNRENTFQADDTYGQGTGQISEGDGILFELKDGLPVLYPLPSLPSTMSEGFVAEIISRFFKVSAISEIYIDQTAHGFYVGNVLGLNSSGFFKANAGSSTTSKVIGVVTEIASENTFRFRPVGSVMTLSVDGDNGDTIYLSQTTDGGYTNIEPESGEIIPLFIKLDDTRVIYTPFSSESSSSSDSSTQDALYGYKLILSDKTTTESGSAERTGIELPTNWTIGPATSFSDLNNMSGTVNDLIIRHNLYMVHSDVKVIQACEDDNAGYFEVRGDSAYTQSRTEYYSGGPGRAIMLSNFCNLNNKLVITVTLLGQNSGEPIVSSTTEKFVETVTYSDSVNMIMKLSRSPIEVNDSIEFTPYDGTDQEWGVDYTVREVINCADSTNDGFYICISPDSIAPDSGSFNGGINPTVGIATLLEVGDSGKVSYFTIAD